LHSSSSYETKDAQQCRNQHSFPKTHFCVHHCMDKPEHIPHTHQCLWYCIHMFAVHIGSSAGQHCIMFGPGNCWPQGSYLSSCSTFSFSEIMRNHLIGLGWLH
jgi:hypothetical protein